MLVRLGGRDGILVGVSGSVIGCVGGRGIDEHLATSGRAPPYAWRHVSQNLPVGLRESAKRKPWRRRKLSPCGSGAKRGRPLSG